MRACWAATLCACSFSHGERPRSDGNLVADGDAAPDAALGPWGAPVEIAELSSGFGEDDPSLTADLLDIYFGSRRGGGFGAEDIWHATRTTTTEAWGTPVNVAELNSAYTETTVEVSPDGLAVFFATTRGINGDADLYFSSRATRTTPWKTPMLVTELNTAGGDYAAFMRSDLLVVFLCAGATTPDEALYTATRASPTTPWGPLARLVELDESQIGECDPMEPRPGVLYYSSLRNSLNDIYRVSRPADGAPYVGREEITAVGTPTSNDRDAWVTADERLMVFSSDRSGIDRLYMSTR